MLSHTSRGRDQIAAMVQVGEAMDVGGQVAGEHQLLHPWFDQLFPFFTAVASEEEVVSMKLWAAADRKTVKGEWRGDSPGDGRWMASSSVVPAQWWQLPSWNRREIPITALGQSASPKQKGFFY